MILIFIERSLGQSNGVVLFLNCLGALVSNAMRDVDSSCFAQLSGPGRMWLEFTQLDMHLLKVDHVPQFVVMYECNRI